MLSQIAFTTHAHEGLTLEDYKLIGTRNDAICKSLGFTGRIYVNEVENFNIIEGESAMVENYFVAFSNDPRIKLTIPHMSKYIQKRAFKDYQVWGYHSKAGENLPAEIHHLNAQTYQASLPQTISLSLRFLLEGYVFENLKAAA